MTARWLGPALLAALLALAPGASAATISSDGTTITISSAPGEFENFYGEDDDPDDYFFFTNEGGSPLTGTGDCVGTAPVSCPKASVTKIVATGGDGDDSMDFRNVALRIEADMGPGADSISGGPLADDIKGGDANDGYLFGGGGADRIEGGNGDDYIHLGSGFEGDIVSGGTGYDHADFAGGGSGFEISLDGVANDRMSGSPTAGNIAGDIEGLVGSAGADTLIGSALDNSITGNDGNDTLVGGGGYDDLSGGDGADTVDTSDDRGEYPQCGPGADTARIDGIDVPNADCESRTITSPDNDGDGSHQPADCNDAHPAIRPGAPEARGNGVDEDCNGADAPAIDADGDGVLETTDCDDGNPARRPGAADVPRNGVDEDCSGADADFRRGSAAVTVLYNTDDGITRILRIRVVGVPRRGRVVVTCRGRGCPRRKRTIKGTGRRLTLTRLFRGARLRPGTVIEVRAFEPGRLIVIRRLRFKAGDSAASDRTRCRRPGEKPLIRCG